MTRTATGLEAKPREAEHWLSYSVREGRSSTDLYLVPRLHRPHACQSCLLVRGFSFSVYQEPLLATQSFAGCGRGRTCQSVHLNGPARGASPTRAPELGKRAEQSFRVCAAGSVSVLSLVRLWKSSTLLDRPRPPGVNLKAGDSRLTAGLGLLLSAVI